MQAENAVERPKGIEVWIQEAKAQSDCRTNDDDDDDLQW